MRILLTADPELPVPPELYGGIERIVDALINELRARGHEVALVARQDSKCLTDASYPWPGKKSRGLIDGFCNTIALRRAVRRFKPDILHSFSRLGYLLPLLPTRLPKIMSYQRHTGGRQISIALKMGNGTIVFTACSDFIAAQGRRWGGHWSVIPNFVDTDRYQPSFSVSPDAALVFLSRVERIKGTHTAIEIARRSGRKLIIAGNKVEIGEGPTYWEKEIAPHIDGRSVEYIGPVNDPQKIELLRKAAALIVPIEWDEPFGIVFVEALACGTPVISCPRGALPEIIEHGRHGFLINSVEDGIKAARQLGELSRNACRVRAKQFFSADIVASQYEALYKRMIVVRGG